MRILVDTDPGVDDALAIGYLAAQPEVRFVAVGSVHGNVPAPQAADNALRLLELHDLADVPVAVGARRPLAQPLDTAEVVHGDDGLGGVAGAPPRGRPVSESAAEQIVRLARAEPGELTLLALGPLTNVALALLLEPELPRLLRGVVVMGGAVCGPGNITPNAEANVYHDPEAADLVLGAGFALTLVGLDVTERVDAGADWLDRFAALPGEPARFVNSALAHYVRFSSEAAGRTRMVLHDPVAAVLAVDPGLATYRELALGVELHGQHTRGMVVARELSGEQTVNPVNDGPRRPVRVASTVDREAVLHRVLAAYE